MCATSQQETSELTDPATSHVATYKDGFGVESDARRSLWLEGWRGDLGYAREGRLHASASAATRDYAAAVLRTDSHWGSSVSFFPQDGSAQPVLHAGGECHLLLTRAR